MRVKMFMNKICTWMQPKELFGRIVWDHVKLKQNKLRTLIQTSITINLENKNA